PTVRWVRPRRTRNLAGVTLHAVRRWRSSRAADRAVDVAVVAVLGVLQPLVLAGGPGQAPATVLVFLAVEPLPLLARRFAPRATLLAVVAVDLAYALARGSALGVGASVVVAAYTLGTRLPRRTSLPALGLGLAGLAAQFVASAGSADLGGPADLVGAMLVVAAAWWVGDAVRTRRAHAAALEARTRELERAREELARRAVVDERLRIARELHDIVAHSMGVVVVQALVADTVLADDPAQARRAVAAIRDTGRATLDELRGLLGALRGDDGTAPLPGLADLDALAAQMTDAGLRVDVRVAGERGDLPRTVDLAAYRVVQESLTNALRHAAGAAVRVDIAYGADAVDVRVEDDGGAPGGAPAPAAGTGNGLAGMAERVAMFGGAFAAGPRPGGGFAVTARLPVGSR
ncbi:MAG TPA: histidine kinase, partial [Micromonosporaceae bacterium]|nr:histidine kinase [Micromonosporaceae bacterium]